jgi:hypothetical protein
VLVKGRDDRSIDIEILLTDIADDFAIINPTDPLRLSKQHREGIEIKLFIMNPESES